MENITGIELVAAERTRQVSEEKWHPSNDVKWDRIAPNNLTRAAISYATVPNTRVMVKVTAETPEKFGRIPKDFPWGPASWKPTPDDRIRELVKAAALLVAQIDVLIAVKNESTSSEEESK